MFFGGERNGGLMERMRCDNETEHLIAKLTSTK